MYKLVAIDLDGTLLNSYGKVSEANSQAIERAIKKGAEIVLCSGRALASVRSLADEVGIENYIICGNGSLIYNIKNEKIIYNNFIEKEKILQIIQICEENSIYYSICTSNNIITKSLNYNVLFYNQENEKKPDNQKTNINIVQDIYKYVKERQEEDYLKINICDDHNVIFNGIIKKLKTINKIDVLDVAHMSSKMIKYGTKEMKIEYYYTEIINQNVNKWKAIEYLVDELKISREDVIAIGDNINDKEMLENAGLGVAMENSAPYIKEFANIVTLDNNLDGVAEILNKYIE